MKRVLVFGLCLLLAQGSLAKPPITECETDPVMLDLDPYLIEALLGSDAKARNGRFKDEGGMPDLLEEPAFKRLIEKHDLRLFNGPMVGCVTPTSAKIWVRTAGAASVQVVAGDVKSSVIKTGPDSDFTAVVPLAGLKPFTEHAYSVLLDGEIIQKDYFRFRTPPMPGQGAKFSITFGSGARYVPEHEGIWRVMSDKANPIAYLGLGDNVYIDNTNLRGTQRLHYYRRMLRQEYREMIASSAIYAMWDDHDMANNDSAGGYGLEEPWKLPNLKVFRQNWNNPFYGLEPDAPGTYCNFRIGDVEVFMTDGRFYRYGSRQAARDGDGAKPLTMLGAKQKRWLLEALKESTAKFKVLASGTMWHEKADKGGADSWAGPRSSFQAERDEIFELIDDEKIGGVILISGDRHRTDIWKTERPNGYPLYEFLSAKMTNMHGHGARKEALWSYRSKERFWGQLDFDTTLEDPTVTFRAFTHEGKELKAFVLRLSELTH